MKPEARRLANRIVPDASNSRGPLNFKTKQTSIPFEFTEFTLDEEKNDWHVSLEQELHSLQASQRIAKLKTGGGP
jgi:hypothetical protein